ncbi:MAG: hypothetical protein HY769_01715 [Candidatus Stahlbacteria bacterium]|nr:hypothetical protein [Candidatus Stahlbacteria bacterium]
MEISFFEEFPTNQVLARLNLIDFPTKLYIAAHSLDEFGKLESKTNIPLVYWIVLKKWEGYWISPFSVRSALQRTFNELTGKPLNVMLDLENPAHAPWLYVVEALNFNRNKQFIKKFIDNSPLPVTLVELSGDDEKLSFWGLHYDNNQANIVKMVYTSLKAIRLGRQRSLIRLREVCKSGVAKYDNRFKIGLGCIATGVAGWEPLLSPDQLAEDLNIAKELGVKEAIIFRLAGLTDSYVNAIKQFISAQRI